MEASTDIPSFYSSTGESEKTENDSSHEESMMGSLGPKHVIRSVQVVTRWWILSKRSRPLQSLGLSNLTDLTFT